MFNYLLEGVVDNKTTGSSTPYAVASGVDLNNGGWIFIAILLAIIVVLIIVIAFMSLKHNNEQQSKTEIAKQQTTAPKEENQAINEFKKLTPQEKQIILDTMINFNKAKNE